MKDENHLICRAVLTQEQTDMYYSLIIISGNQKNVSSHYSNQILKQLFCGISGNKNISVFNMVLDKFMRRLYNRAFCSGRELGPIIQEDLSVLCYHANSQYKQQNILSRFMVHSMGKTCQSDLSSRRGSEVLTDAKVRLCYCRFSEAYNAGIVQQILEKRR